MYAKVMQPTIQYFDSHRYKILIAMLLAMMLVVIFAPTSYGGAGLGGYISEKLIERSGATTSNLLLSTDGSGQIQLGIAPIATILTPTNITQASTTLRGQLTSLNNFPLAWVWFEWGYDNNCSEGSTSVQTITATGTYTTSLSGYNEGKRVYYRMAASTDGTYRTGIAYFESGSVPGHTLLWYIIPVALVALFAVTVLRNTGYMVIILMGVAVVICWLIVQAILNM